MRKISIKILGIDESNPNTMGYLILNVLKKHYDVEISDSPDFLFYNESVLDYLEYDCIKIFYTAENVTPNFNLCDYAVGFDYLDFEDRYYRYPIYLVEQFFRKDELVQSQNLDFTEQLSFTREDLMNKKDFCSFVYSNYLGGKEREFFFNRLSSYKKVNSGGNFLNNIGYRTDNKLEFEMGHKFSIAFENSSRSGYTTEKMACSLVAKTIPIYWGNKNISAEFNAGRFINCHDYKNFDEVVDRVIEIDNNDELYLSMINQPVMNKKYDIDLIKAGFESFLKNILDQPVVLAKRRTINGPRLVIMEKNEKIICKINKRRSLLIMYLAKAYQPIKKLGFSKSLKRLYIRYYIK